MTHPGEQFYPEGVRWDAPIARGTLPDLLASAVAAYGARPALEFRDRPISFTELAARVEQGTWDTALPGEIWSLAGSRSWFGPEPFDDALAGRLAQGDIHPSGPLWGEGEPPATDVVGALERQVAAEHADLAEGLVKARMEHERRALRLMPKDLRWRWLDDATLELAFELPAGAYATVVVRELANVGA